MKKEEVKNRFVVEIDLQRCKGCSLCVLYCPKKVLSISDKVNLLGYRYCKVVDEESCSGCGSCYLMCPEYCIKIYKK